MMGSDIFIMVALRCTENNTPFVLGVFYLLINEFAQSAAAHKCAVKTLRLPEGAAFLSEP